MRIEANRIASFVLAAIAVVGCGGSLGGNGPTAGQGGGTGQGGQGGGPPIACAAMGACECFAASDRCTARTEACWCPSECSPAIDCICGGGRFLACEDNADLASCRSALTAVQTKCATQSFVMYLGDLCNNAAYIPSCVAGCLADLNATGACSEIDCSFCPVCDCAAPLTPSPFRACIAGCLPTPPPGLE